MSKKNHEYEQEANKPDQKDPELFENEPLDTPPSRKGRIVSTLIVIVVAILVIWVFARNNEEPKNETAKEGTKEEEAATAAPLAETSEAANEAARPADQLAASRSEFDATGQAIADEITGATELALANFDDKKSAASEQLNNVAANFQKTAAKTIDQSLTSAKNKVKRLSQANLKSLTALRAKIAAKTTVDQLEAALPDANTQLDAAKEQVMDAINENTEKLTATIDSAVAQTLEQDETAKRQLVESASTATEVEIAETETKPASTTGESIEVTAESGDSVTKLARKALTSAMDSGQVSQDLSAEQRIYVEDYLQNRTGSQRVNIGDRQAFAKDLLNEAVGRAKNLNEAQLEHLKIYSSRVNF